MQNVIDVSSNDVIHPVYESAEKVLLPHFLREPGQLHFVTGLKVNLFTVHSSNKHRSFLYYFPGGHWPGGKTASEVAPMVYYNICEHCLDS